MARIKTFLHVTIVSCLRTGIRWVCYIPSCICTLLHFEDRALCVVFISYVNKTGSLSWAIQKLPCSVTFPFASCKLPIVVFNISSYVKRIAIQLLFQLAAFCSKDERFAGP